MRPGVIKQVVDNVKQSEGEIVVTTTISLDRSALEQRGGRESDLSDSEFAFNPPPGVRAGIQLKQIGPKTYLGLVDNRTRAHPLYIGDTLFLFVPRQQSVSRLVELVADLLRQMPVAAHWQESQETLDTERILQALSESGQYPALSDPKTKDL